MNIINYKGNLKEDIENSQKKFNSKKKIITGIINTCISLPPAFFLFIAFCHFDYKLFYDYYKEGFIISFALAAPIVQGIRYKLEKKRYLRMYKDSNQNLDNLVCELRDENILVSKENIQSAIIKKHQEKRFESINNVKKSVKINEEHFYFLDSEEKLRYLKSIRNILVENKKVIQDETTLYYSDEDLTFQENIPVRVINYLKKM